MLLKDIKGNEKLTQRLSTVIKKGNISHAYIFEGDSCVDKRLIANCFIKAVLCEERPGEGCDHCRSCLRIEHGNHDSIFYVEKTESTTKNDAVLEMMAELQKKPYEGERNFAVIEEADSMTRAAQNSILKTLEEPQPGTVIILLSENSQNLLPTVRSRCVSCRFNPFGTPEYAALSEKAEKLAEMIGQKRPFYEIRSFVAELTGDTGKEKDKTAVREKSLNLLDALELVYGDMAKDETKSSRLYRKADIYRAVEAIEEARREVRSFVKPSYALNNMVLRIGG